MKPPAEELRQEIWAILYPAPEEDMPNLDEILPHHRLKEHFGLDTSYFQPRWSITGDRRYDTLVEDPEDPVNKIIESTHVPDALIYSSLNLFAESLITYCSEDRSWLGDKNWGVYRYFPSILMTIWSAFEAWVRITSDLFVQVTAGLPPVVENALMERRPYIDDKLRIGPKDDHRSTLDRYRILLKYACNIEYPKGDKIWQKGKSVVDARDELVHYKTSIAPTLTMKQIWEHIEAVLLLFIGPSTKAKRTLFLRQFGYHYMLMELQRFIIKFEERPLHKGWTGGYQIIYCPFDGVNEVKYPKHHKNHRS